MKIKVTFEREFDSDIFYGEDGENLTFDEFKSDVSNFLWEWSDDEVIQHSNFEEIKE